MALGQAIEKLETDTHHQWIYQKSAVLKWGGRTGGLIKGAPKIFNRWELGRCPHYKRMDDSKPEELRRCPLYGARTGLFAR
jgi:hypothetical protein